MLVSTHEMRGDAHDGMKQREGVTSIDSTSCHVYESKQLTTYRQSRQDKQSVDLNVILHRISSRGINPGSIRVVSMLRDHSRPSPTMPTTHYGLTNAGDLLCDFTCRWWVTACCFLPEHIRRMSSVISTAPLLCDLNSSALTRTAMHDTLSVYWIIEWSVIRLSCCMQ